MRDLIDIVESCALNEATAYFGGFKQTPDRSLTSKYMRGWCPYFALALHDVHKLQLVGLAEHFAAKLPDGRFCDIRGIMSEDQFLDGIADRFREYYDTSREEVINELESGFYKCGFFEESDLKKAKALVKKLLPSLPLTEGIAFRYSPPRDFGATEYPVFRNGSASNLAYILERSSNQEYARALLSEQGDLYFWDSYAAVHVTIAEKALLAGTDVIHLNLYRDKVEVLRPRIQRTEPLTPETLDRVSNSKALRRVLGSGFTVIADKDED